METNIDNNFYAESLKYALKVGFISSSEELRLYATAIYNAMVWGREIDRKNKAVRERDKSVK